MTDASIIERLKVLETEIESLKVKVTEDYHWRKILEEWLINRFGFDVKIELKNKPLSYFSLPEGKTSDKKEIDPVEEEESTNTLVPDDMLIASEDTNNLEKETVSPVVNEPNSPPAAESKEVDISKPTNIPDTPALCSRVGSNVNFAVIVNKTTPERALPDKESSTVLAPKIPMELATEIDLTKAFITEVSQIPENTEYHVTLKAKNAIKKLEDRENSYECKECKQVFDNIYKAEGHARHHFETKFKCIDCPLYFEVEQDLILHAQVVHYKIRKRLNLFTCYIGGCSFASKSPEALRHHRTLKHSESKPTVNTQESPTQAVTDSTKTDSAGDVEIQDVSGEASNSSAPKAEDKPLEPSPRKAEADDLISYKGRNNGENSQWQCKVCEKTFSELSLAKTHVGKTHFTLHFPSSEKKGRHVVCRICKKAFSNDNWLKRHELSEHRSSIKKYALL